MTRVAELRQQMAATHTQIEGILAKSRAEKRSLNTEEQAAYDAAYSDISNLQKTIQAEERSAELNAKLAEDRAKQEEEARAAKGIEERKTEPLEVRQKKAFETYIRFGLGEVDEDGRRLMAEMRGTTDYGKQLRALSIVTNTAGQYTVPTSWETSVVTGMKFYAGVLQAGAEEILTSSGAPINYPTINDTANVASIIAENTAATSLDVAFGSKTLGAFKYTSRLILVPNELLQDTAVNIERVITASLAERFGRGFNGHLTTGDGSTQPEGAVTASTLGNTTAGVAAVTALEILDLIHSVDPAYRPTARLMFHDSTLKAILKLVDSQNRPLFQTDYTGGRPATVHGYPFQINNDMSTMATGNKFMLFGDFKYIKVRRVQGMDFMRLTERYAEANQTAFLGFARMDAKFIDASGGALKHMKNA